MSTDNNASQESTIHWNKYWDGSHDSASFGDGGVNHPFLLNFWSGYFSTLLTKNEKTEILDVASGNGAVLTAGQLDQESENTAITCIDSSEKALQSLKLRFPHVNTLECDARNIPLKENHFDVVTSQFGIEYAGVDAISNIAKLVKPGGQLALVLHHDKGSIYSECSANLMATKHLQDSDFLPLAIKMFEAGFSSLQNKEPGKAKLALMEFMPVFKSLESIMDQYGVDVGGGTITTLYNSIAEIQQKIGNYVESDVITWLQDMDAEIPSYLGRMQAMLHAAISAEVFEDLSTSLTAQNFSLGRAQEIKTAENAIPLAWLLVATKK
jgi:ubiquinone/menaquinone biosynthesis C-methylase UbiE